MKTEQITIEGMTCGHCTMSVKKELTKIGVEVLDVLVGSAEIKYDPAKVNKEQIAAAIDEAGYKLVNVQ